GSPLRVVHDDVVLERKSDLQRQPDQQAQIRRSKHAPFRMRKQNRAEIVLPSLQAYGRDVADILFRQRLPELLKPAARKSRQRFRIFRQIAEGDEAASPVSEFADIFSATTFFQLAYELGRKPT